MDAGDPCRDHATVGATGPARAEATEIRLSRDFHDADPRLSRAYVDALDEASRFIAAEPQMAAAIYNELSATKVPEPMMLRILAQKGTRFSGTPSCIGLWAAFMKSAGLIRQDVVGCKRFFFPEGQAMAGN